jgi:hypothetical protein
MARVMMVAPMMSVTVRVNVYISSWMTVVQDETGWVRGAGLPIACQTVSPRAKIDEAPERVEMLMPGMSQEGWGKR